MSRQEMGVIDQVLMATALAPGLRFPDRAQPESTFHLHSCHTGSPGSSLQRVTKTFAAPAATIPGKAGAGAADTGTAWLQGGAGHISLGLSHQEVILRQERKVGKNLQC